MEKIPSDAFYPLGLLQSKLMFMLMRQYMQMKGVRCAHNFKLHFFSLNIYFMYVVDFIFFLFMFLSLLLLNILHFDNRSVRKRWNMNVNSPIITN